MADLSSNTYESSALLLLEHFKSSSFLDQHHFESLCRDTDHETALKILNRFYMDIAKNITSLAQSGESGDAENLWKICHKISGASELIGFSILGKKCRDLSLRIKSNPDTDQYQSSVQSLIEYLEVLKKELNSVSIDWTHFSQ